MILNILHSFVNIFAGGRSEIKTLLFVLYFTILSALYLLLKKYSFKKLEWKYFGITLLVMYLYGLFLHIFYTLYNHLSVTDFLITGNNGEISSSTLWHTHIAKAFLGQIFSFFNKNQLQTIDAGGAYIGLIPSPILLLGSVILIILLSQSILYFVTSFKELLTNKNSRQKIFLILGYAMISFSLVKTTIDGGILNPSLGIGLIFITLFILRLKGKNIANYYYLSSIIGVVLLFSSLYIDTFKYGNSLDVSLIASLLLLYTMLLYATEDEIRLQFFIPILVLLASSWWVASIRDRSIYEYSNTPLPSGQQFYFYNEKSKEVEKIKNEKNQTIGQLSRKLNKNITYMPITASGITCMESALPQRFSTEIISTKQIFKNEMPPSPYIEITNNDSVSFGKNWQTNLHILVNPCIPEPLSVINGELEKNNINTYLFVNPLFYSESNN